MSERDLKNMMMVGGNNLKDNYKSEGHQQNDNFKKSKTQAEVLADNLNNINRAQSENTEELRKLVDDGKKELGEGIVIVFTSKDEKVGVAVGITNKLTNKYDAVKFVKLSSEIIGGQGGGGRKDFAQAGGQNQNKINDAFEKIKTLI